MAIGTAAWVSVAILDCTVIKALEIFLCVPDIIFMLKICHYDNVNQTVFRRKLSPLLTLTSMENHGSRNRICNTHLFLRTQPFYNMGDIQ
jgi:hypothetical protein